MSWWDSASRSWQGGYPPNAQAFEQTMRKLKRTAPVELAETAAPPATINGLTPLAEAQERRRRRHAEQEARWLTETEAAEQLGLSTADLYRDASLLVNCEVRHGGELYFSREDVAKRAAMARGEAASEDDASRGADALLAELRAQGIDPLGGDAA